MRHQLSPCRVEAPELEAAHEKGYKKCEDNFKDMQKMMKDWEKK